MNDQVKYSWVKWKIKPIWQGDKYVEIDFDFNTGIEDAISCAIEIAKEIEGRVCFELKGLKFKVEKKSTFRDVIKKAIFN
jgi:hypothetical protein